VANTSATIAFVLSLLGLVFTPIVDVAAVIVGHHALSTIRRTGEAGAGLAKAALAIGYGLIGVGALVTAFLIAMIFGSIAQ
jgi:peptidyl-prolyl cis-trans isomerase B (cyclophilin B)